MSLLTSVTLFFFFSSRRRHTRCLSDWSSDVCSSDLDRAALRAVQPAVGSPRQRICHRVRIFHSKAGQQHFRLDRKSTRLNSSHLGTSYAVFCLKKKNKKKTDRLLTHKKCT